VAAAGQNTADLTVTGLIAAIIVVAVCRGLLRRFLAGIGISISF